MSTLTYAIPAEEKDLLLNLRIVDEQHHRPGDALADEKQLDRARGWLTRILLDVRARVAHTDWLCEAYQAKFRPPLPRRLCDGLTPPRPEPSSRFRYYALLDESQAVQILSEGVGGLPASEVAQLLLNPYATWDLADRIDAELPEYWLPLMDQVGEEMGRDLGIEIALPDVDAPNADQGEGVERQLACSMMAGAAARAVHDDCWELSLDDASELRRRLAEELYGDGARTFRLYLHRRWLEGEPRRAEFQLEVTPAPTRQDVPVRITFPGGEVRSFELKVPPTAPGTLPPDSLRSAACEPLSEAGAVFQGEGQWQEGWPPNLTFT
jgi:hypothetical protein